MQHRLYSTATDLPALAPWARHQADLMLSGDTPRGGSAWRARLVIDPAGNEETLDLKNVEIP